ncbi:MAG: shikimate dehydrogenase [Geminicoccaceae bacterium]|nr:shikimate dehydrogenase [Geminicoccaceae bacterium]
MLLSGKARLAGVLGWPVAHSLSPRLHGHWFARYRIDGVYVPLPVRPEDLELAFRALPRLGFLGWNVTIPHKERAFALVDRRDAAAERTGVVNTVLVHPDGTLEGRNTDGAGFLAHLRAEYPDFVPATALVLGAGGAARAVAFALLEAGCAQLRLCNRTSARARALAAGLARLFPDRVLVCDWPPPPAALSDLALLVNATSLGMTGQPPLLLDLAPLPAGAIVADLVYVPLATPLLTAARARGLRVLDGLGMLVHQAVPGFAWWGGRVPEVDEELRRCLLEALEAPARTGLSVH